MSRCAFLAAALIVVLPAGPCFAVDAKQKMATCQFGADQQRLQGEARDAFLKKCMEDRGTIRAAGRLPEPSPGPSNSSRIARPWASRWSRLLIDSWLFTWRTGISNGTRRW